MASKDIMVQNSTAQFKVAVGNVASGVGVGDKLLRDMRRKLTAPEDICGGAIRQMNKGNATHATARGVSGTRNRWLLG